MRDKTRLTRDFLRRKTAEYEVLAKEIEALRGDLKFRCIPTPAQTERQAGNR